MVWATGDLNNADAVLSAKYTQRISDAERQDGIINIIDTNDLKEGGITTDHPVNAWHFTANDVTEFVFATSDQYVWESASLMVDPKTGRRTRVDAVFDPKHKDYEEVIDFARKTAEAMSYTFRGWPYPYPHETVFEGLDQMEYPMMVNDNPLKSRSETIELTFTFEDGTTQKLHRSIAVWEKGNKTVELTLRSDKRLKEVKLGSTYDADTDSANNVYIMK